MVIRCLPACALLFLPLCNAFPQEENATGYIEFIDQLSSQDIHDKTGFFHKLANIILGKESIEIKNPVDVYADSPEVVWILSQGNSSIIMGNRTGLKKAKFKGKRNISLPSLVGICAADKKQLLFTDSYNNKIYALSRDGTELEEFGTNLSLDRPTGIACSELSGDIWVVETNGHRVSILDREGNFIKSIGDRGTKNSQFNYPTHIWIDSEGNVYIVDSMNYRVQVFDKDGKFLYCFGEAGNASGYMARPKGIASDSYGNIYLADALFHTVQIFDKEGNFLYSFGSQGKGEGQFWLPNGLYIDKNNYIYVSDNYNNRIQIFRLVKNP
jgi:DNA-binding beta-propeller fold protein YncE